MSRIGDAPINIPDAVNVEVVGRLVKAIGPLGQLELEHRPEIKVEHIEKQLIVKKNRKDQQVRALHGLTRSLINNMVIGVEKGWQKRLELVGVGFRAQTSGEKLTLNVGFSHPVEITAPAGVKFAVEDNTKIIISGIDKYLVGQIAATIRAVKPPEPYQGKGIRYAGEHVRRKAGKAGKAGAAGAK
ncbi:50S ribosomal protein L6 [Patescibacteria group bacterium]|nr:50S ribosomal protein L6 [Patescibacteria group bacterium]MCL5409339.1 50S ribosomal protein L6 [Patescibacteria group bacterium]